MPEVNFSLTLLKVWTTLMLIWMIIILIKLKTWSTSYYHHADDNNFEDNDHSFDDNDEKYSANLSSIHLMPIYHHAYSKCKSHENDDEIEFVSEHKSCFSVWAPPLLLHLPGSKRTGKLWIGWRQIRQMADEWRVRKLKCLYCVFTTVGTYL